MSGKYAANIEYFFSLWNPNPFDPPREKYETWKSNKRRQNLDKKRKRLVVFLTVIREEDETKDCRTKLFTFTPTPKNPKILELIKRAAENRENFAIQKAKSDEIDRQNTAKEKRLEEKRIRDEKKDRKLRESAQRDAIEKKKQEEAFQSAEKEEEAHGASAPVLVLVEADVDDWESL